MKTDRRAGTELALGDEYNLPLVYLVKMEMQHIGYMASPRGMSEPNRTSIVEGLKKG